MAYLIPVTVRCIQIEKNLPPGDKPLTLSAPYLTQNEFVMMTIDRFLLWLPLIFNILQVVYKQFLLPGGQKLPNAHLRLGYNSCY